jgi:hypothetical protein
VKHHVVVGGRGLPLALAATPANRNDVTQLLPLVDAIPHVPGRIGRLRHRPTRLIADRGYDHDLYRRAGQWARTSRDVTGDATAQQILYRTLYLA